MQTVRKDVNAEVLKMIYRVAKPGAAVTPSDWKQAYKMVHAQAVADTLIWKENNITIDRR